MQRWIILTLLVACGGAPADSAARDTAVASDGCTSLCSDAGFRDGTETDYGGGLVECVCEGTGAALTQDACTDYCAGFGVDAAHSYLGEDVSPNDKCACDGTGS
jgi:hypothetical protein